MKKKSPFASPETVLVTGAASGIGKEIAREFSRRGHPVVIVAPCLTELEDTAQEIQSTTGTHVQVLAQDLRSPQAALEIFDQLEDSGVEVDILVNNAGVDHRGGFGELPLENSVEMVEVNILAVLRLTKQFLPGLLARGRGRILNTASITDSEFGPLSPVYQATQAFLLAWSQALATELADRGVTVTALCPSGLEPDFNPPGAAGWANGNPLSPAALAHAGVAAALRGQHVVVSAPARKITAWRRPASSAFRRS